MMANVSLFHILLVVLYIIDSQCVPEPNKVRIASKNQMLREKLRNFNENLEVFKNEFHSRMFEIITPVWYSLEEFAKNESQRVIEEKGDNFVIPFCYVRYIDNFMLELRGIFFVDVGISCFREEIGRIVRTFLTMGRYVRVIDTMLEAIEVCHVEGSELPSQMLVQNIFCDHSKRHFNIEGWFKELEETLSKLEQDVREYNWVQDQICFDSISKRLENNLTDIFPVILTECVEVGTYTGMLERLSLLPFSVNKFMPSVTQEQIDETTIDLDVLDDTVDELRGTKLVSRFEMMLRNEGLFRRLMIAAKNMQDVQKYMEENIVLYHNTKFKDISRVVQAIIQKEDRDDRCTEIYIHLVLSDLEEYYNSKIAPKCFDQMFVVLHAFRLLPQTALSISESLTKAPTCKPEWRCDKAESQIVFIEQSLKHWEQFNTTEFLANADKCYEEAREVVQGNAFQNLPKMKECDRNLELTKDMFYVL